MRIYYAGEWWYYKGIENGFWIYQNLKGETLKLPVQEIPDACR